MAYACAQGFMSLKYMYLIFWHGFRIVYGEKTKGENSPTQDRPMKKDSIMQAATAQTNEKEKPATTADRPLREGKRDRAERLLRGTRPQGNAKPAPAQPEAEAKLADDPRANLSSLRNLRRPQPKLQTPRTAEAGEASEAGKDLAGRGGKHDVMPRLEMPEEKPVEAAHEVKAKQKPARELPRRKRRTLWSFGVWFCGHDWVRFGVAAVAILMIGQVLSIMAAASAYANTRIKDIVAVEGVRDNLLVGYGLVVGLDGTGDKLKNSAFTGQSLSAFLERLGVNTRGVELKTKNVAAVTVTATLPPFSRQGSRIDVSVSAMGDAQSLQGGTLLATPLYAADGQVYAVAQGALAVGGFSAGGDAAAVTKGVPTSGGVANGAIVEREIAFELNNMATLDLSLRNPDVTTATRIAATINDRVGRGAAVLRDPATVRVRVPDQYQNNVTMFLAQIEQLPVETDQIARVVIDEATGTIVMGENVRIDTVAVAQGNLIVKVQETPQVSQPGAFAPPGAETVVVPRTNVAIDEEEANQMVVLNRGATLNELVAGLNALGVGPRDLITILQTIKAAGALQADILAR